MNLAYDVKVSQFGTQHASRATVDGATSLEARIASIPGCAEALVLLLATEHHSVPAFLRAVLALVANFIPSDLSFVAIVEEFDGVRWLVLKDSLDSIIGAESGEWGRSFHRLRVGGEDLPIGERSFVGFVAHSMKARRSEDVTREPYYRASNEGVRSEIAVPIVFEERLLGVLNLESKMIGWFSDEHLGLLELVATVMAPTLESLMIQEGLQRPSAVLLERIGQRLSAFPVGGAVAGSRLFSEVASIIATAFASRICLIFLLDENERPVVAASYDEGVAITPDILRELEEIAVQSIALRQHVSFTRETSSRGLPGASACAVSDFPSFAPYIAIPLIASGFPVGVLIIAKRDRVGSFAIRHYSGSDIHLLNAIQSQLGAFVELKRLEHFRRSESSARSRQLSEISSLFAESELNLVLQRVVNRVPDLCGAAFCSVFLWDDKRRMFLLAASKGLRPALIGEVGYVPGEGLTGWVGLHGKSLLLDSRSQADLERVAPDLRWASKLNEAGDSADHRLHPFLAVPIFARGITVGVLRVSGTGRFFTEQDELALTLVANKISAAIAYSRRYEERIRLLRGLQCLMGLCRSMRIDRAPDEHREMLLREAVRQATTVFSADIAVLYPMVRDSLQFPPTWEGEIFDPSSMRGQLYGEEVPQVILGRREAVYWPEAQSETILVGSLPDRSSATRPRFVERERISSSAGIPLKIGDSVLGVLFLNFRGPQEFDIERRELIETFASQLALSLELIALAAAIRESASRDEALALARELHDVVSVLSLSVVNRAGVILDQLNLRQQVDIIAEVRSLERRASDCVAELRGIMGQLRKSDDDTAPASALIASYIRSLSGGSVSISFTVDGDETLLPAIHQRQAFLICRELIINAVRHSRASSIEVTLSISAAGATLRVHDDGIGLPEAIPARPGHFGFETIRHRVARFAGALEICSGAAGGTTVTATFSHAHSSASDARS